jgi:hypothetical protein
MHRSRLHSLSLLALALAVTAPLAVAGCAGDDDATAPPAATTAAQPAAPKAPAADRLDASDASILHDAATTVAGYCAGRKATAGEVTGAVATIESLFEIDPQARGADGRSVQRVSAALERKLRACGDRAAARRLAKLGG